MKHWRFDLFLAIAALCTCIPIASITIHRCRLSWHFILIGIWKLVTSVSVACISVHRCILVHQGKNNRRPLLWLLLYLAGTAVGMTGLCSLLWTSFRQDQTVRNLTYGFAAPMILIPVLVAIHWFVKHLDLKEGGGAVWLSAILSTLAGAVVAFATVFSFFSALYGDLVLGAIADNLLGLPSADFAPLYWVWFIAKRLPMLSF
ncbi:hypothetical protein BU25DRAFT_349931 [Macroventuria anomochaeta]|uniref:Uncharacterized protein n=1 Tax=Macroventuria anomochaeta TaxID=301207 RepID=A0ACB6RQ30_9PLEO|nr:uncharacterized protein BU25DRAFT_349931 [Macroventuria anomochaeta]KAF2623500.1 hypothetical protein BU25DRAFT_349931 [Macroventuria anomochaeta]